MGERGILKIMDIMISFLTVSLVYLGIGNIFPTIK